MPDAKPIQDALASIMKSIGAEAEHWTAQLATIWADVVGPDVARHTRPGMIDRQCLTVYVDSSVWLNELSRYGQQRMLENLRQHAGAARIRQVVLRLDPDGC